MNIKVKTIIQGIKMLNNSYIGALDKIIKDEKDFKEMVKVWREAFEIIEGDYEEANDDFITAIKIITTNNKYFPTISEILEEMKKLFFKRKEKEEDRIKTDISRIARKLGLEEFTEKRTIDLYMEISDNIGEENIENKVAEEIEQEKIVYNYSDRNINSLIEKVYKKVKENK